MDIKNEERYNKEREEVLNEIKYRESIMLHLQDSIYRKRGFICYFIRDILKIKKPTAPMYRSSKDDKYGYRIDSDIELEKDIYNALNKSKNRLIEVYNSIKPNQCK